MRRALIKSRLIQRRPLRLCIHEVTIIYEAHGHGGHSLGHGLGGLTKGFVPLETGSQPSAPRVFCQFSTTHLPKSISSKLTPLVPISALAALPSEHQSLKATNTELRRSAMLNLLQLGHQMEPQTDLQTHTDQKALTYPPNTMFLTITVQHFEHGRDNQLYRNDVPLYPLQVCTRPKHLNTRKYNA